VGGGEGGRDRLGQTGMIVRRVRWRGHWWWHSHDELLLNPPFPSLQSFLQFLPCRGAQFLSLTFEKLGGNVVIVENVDGGDSVGEGG